MTGVRRAARITLGLGVIAGAAFTAYRMVKYFRDAQSSPYETRADAPATAARPSATAWVEPVDGSCPASHPIKAKLSSGLFHLPGMLAYERTKPDRCYGSEDAAAADGLTRAKR